MQVDHRLSLGSPLSFCAIAWGVSSKFQSEWACGLQPYIPRLSAWVHFPVCFLTLPSCQHRSWEVTGMAVLIGFLPPMSENRVVLLAPGMGPSPAPAMRGSGGVNLLMRALSVPLPFSKVDQCKTLVSFCQNHCFICFSCFFFKLVSAHVKFSPR